MPRGKKGSATGEVATTAPDGRSKERKSIDRARSFVARMDGLCRPGLANIAPAAKLVLSGKDLPDSEDQRALVNLRDECGDLMEYLPIIMRKIEQIETATRTSIRLADTNDE